MRGKAIRTRKVRWLAALLVATAAVFALPTTALAAPQNDSLGVVYVLSTGSDENGAGTQESPVATLARAVELAAPGTSDNPTEIYVMSDLEMTAPARYWNKHISITSLGDSPFTVSRGDFASIAHDDARGNYNSAMIEVNGRTDQGVVSTLLLTNIIFDDGGIHEGEYFIQASTRGNGTTDFGDLSGDEAISNSNIVQDSMIAVYNGVGRITLGNGAVLKNYGGMSAVRLSGGELVMQSGSIITDDETVTDRIQGEEIPGTTLTYSIKDLYGPAGAVWIQGGKLVMEQDSTITNIVGRSVFNGSGTAIINGTISRMRVDTKTGPGDGDMWHGTAGSALFLRNEYNTPAVASLGDTGVIDGSNLKTPGSAIKVQSNCELTAHERSVVKNVAGASAFDIGGTAYLNGEITGLTAGGHAILAQDNTHYIKIGKTAIIHRNTSWYGVIYTQGYSGVIDIYGKINDNISTDRGGALVLANNGNHVEVNMYDGAEMCRNVSYQTGGAVMVSCGTFTMYGGTISGNISGADATQPLSDLVGGGVHVRKGGQFIMNGGSISSNASANVGGSIAIEMGDYNNSVPYVRLNGGSVSDGMMNATVSEDDGSYSATGGTSNDITIVSGDTYGHMSRYLSISDDFSLDNTSIFMDDYDLYIDNPAAGVKLGNAAKVCEKAVTDKFDDQYLDVIVGSFWYHSDSAAQRFSLEIANTTYDSNKQLVAAYVATDENGMPQGGATPTLVPVDVEDKQASLTVPGGGNGYAVVLLQENDNSRGIISIVPADLTAYTGGSGGYENVVGPGGTTDDSTLPRPVFRVVSSPVNINVEDFIFTNTIKKTDGTLVSSHSWKLEPVDVVEDGERYYRFVGTEESTPEVRFQFTDVNGNATTDGEFNLEEEEELYKQFRISIYSGAAEGQTSTVTVTYNNHPYTPVIGFGELTVRATAEEEPVSEVLLSKPESIAPGKAAAVVDADTVFTLGGTDVVLSNKNDGFSPSLLFDGIIDEDGTNRTEALLARIDGATTENSQARYLDLVDPNNGNAWIASSKGVTIYWALPEGVPEDAEIAVWHFKGLHRDADGSGFDIDEVENVTPEKVDFSRDSSAIVFHVDKGGFSPFVLTWDAPDEPDTPVTPPSTKYYEITASAGEGGSISPSGTHSYVAGSDVSFSITPDEGYTVGSVTVDGVDVGQRSSYTFADLDDDHTISVTFMPGSAPVDPDDTGVSDWLETDEHVAYLHGYGDGSGTFGPENSMTRAEVAQMFYNLLLDKSMGDRPVAFEDVPEGAYYEEPVRVLASRGILNGTDPTTYEPDRPITRAEFVAIAMRFSNGEFEGENAFVDVPEDAWYRDYVVGATSFGWIYGYQDGSHRFGPDDTITRGQATMVTNRMLGRVADGAWIVGHLGDVRTFSDLPQGHYAFFDVVEATNAHDYERDGRYENWTGLAE